MLSFIDPAIVLSMLMLSFIFVIVCGLFEWKRTCAGFFYRLLIMYCRGRSSYQAVELGSHQPVCSCHIFESVQSQELDFQRHMSWYFCLQWVQLIWEVIFSFVSIGRIDAHRCLKFLFKTIFKAECCFWLVCVIEAAVKHFNSILKYIYGM